MIGILYDSRNSVSAVSIPIVTTIRPTFLLGISSSSLSSYSNSNRNQKPHHQKLSVFVRAKTSTSMEELRRREEVKKRIAELYDEASGIWEDIWGDHIHHGFYDPTDSPSLSLPDHCAAQIRMIQEALAFASISDDPSRRPKYIVDVGCGLGGSSRYLARTYGARCQGITLSPVQVQRAQSLAVYEGLADKVFFQVADALEQPFADEQFDLVWSMESGEHMPDKTKFVSELARVAAPGGTIIIATCWCHRDLSPSEESLQPDEKQLLSKIYDAYCFPG